MEADNVTG